MNYFYIADNDNTLKYLPDFRLVRQEPEQIAVPTLKGVRYISHKTGADVFICTPHSSMPQVGNFRVVDENATVYECAGSRVGVGDAPAIITGVVNREFVPENKEEALEVIKKALESIK
ncbi:MAG TPA: hypothetical protein VGM54_02010 [Chthoniobacter sp.]|jgi:hypothetical protein